MIIPPINKAIKIAPADTAAGYQPGGSSSLGSMKI
jgi:hypothetical protein